MIQQRSKSFEIEIWGVMGMFTTPHSRKASTRISYPYPTYSALKQIMEAIFHLEGVKWVVECCRVMNRIEYASVGILTPHIPYKNNMKRRRFEYLYLDSPRYQIRAHLVLDKTRMNSPNYNLRHDGTVERAILQGGWHQVFLGKRDCLAFVRPCCFGTGAGYYDDIDDVEPVYMFHHFDTYGNGKIKASTFCQATMVNGVIDYTDIPKVTRRWVVDVGDGTGKNGERAKSER